MVEGVGGYIFIIKISNEWETTTVQVKAYWSMAKWENPLRSMSNAMSAAW